MFAAVTDHVFIDGGHTLDFTNKAFEALAYAGCGRGRDSAADPRPPDRGRIALGGDRRVAPSRTT